MISNQIVYLNFDDIQLHEDMESYRTEIIDTIAQQVRSCYSGCPIEITLEPPIGIEYSTIYMIDNGPDVPYLGIASDVDYGNRSRDDFAIVRLDEIIEMGPNYHQFITLSSNIACHELGHIIGLEHNTDPYDLMCQGDCASMERFANHPPQLTSAQEELVTYNIADGLLIENLVLQYIAEFISDEDEDIIAVIDFSEDFSSETNDYLLAELGNADEFEVVYSDFEDLDGDISQDDEEEEDSKDDVHIIDDGE